MAATLPTPGPSNVGWVIEDYDELSSDLSIFIEVETTREEEPPSDPRVPFTYGPSRTIVRRSSYYGMIDEIELDGPITYHHVQHPSGAITRLIGSVGGKPWIIARMLDTRGRDLTSTTPSRSKDMTEYIDETEYTDEELALALHAATYVRSGSIDINHDTSQAPRQIHTSLLNDLRAILKHLPAQQGDWEECPIFGAPRPGDRLRIRWACGDVHEGVITSRSRDHIQLDSTQVNRRDNARLEYIPAPVQHPDPERHPAIHVEECDIVGFIPKIMVWYRDSYVAGRQGLSPEQITDWHPIDPAKVVADND